MCSAPQSGDGDGGASFQNQEALAHIQGEYGIPEFRMGISKAQQARRTVQKREMR